MQDFRSPNFISLGRYDRDLAVLPHDFLGGGYWSCAANGTNLELKYIIDEKCIVLYGFLLRSLAHHCQSNNLFKLWQYSKFEVSSLFCAVALMTFTFISLFRVYETLADELRIGC